MKKLFGTYQAREVEDILKKTDYTSKKLQSPNYNAIVNKVGFKPIFAIEFKDMHDFLIKSFMISPTYPERLILFTSEDYISYDFLAYNQELRKGTLPLEAPIHMEETILRKIEKDSVLGVVNLSDSKERSNDDFLEAIFGSLYMDVCNILKTKEWEFNEKFRLVPVEYLPPLKKDIIMSVMETLFYNPDNISQDQLSRYYDFLKKNIFIKR